MKNLNKSQRSKFITVAQLAIDNGWLGNKANEFIEMITREDTSDDYLRYNGYFIDIFSHDFARAISRGIIASQSPQFLEFDETWESETTHKLFAENFIEKYAMELLQKAVVTNNPLNYIYDTITRTSGVLKQRR